MKRDFFVFAVGAAADDRCVLAAIAQTPPRATPGEESAGEFAVDPLSSGGSALPADRCREATDSGEDRSIGRDHPRLRSAACGRWTSAGCRDLLRSGALENGLSGGVFPPEIGCRHAGRARQGSGAGRAIERRQVALDNAEGSRGSRFSLGDRRFGATGSCDRSRRIRRHEGFPLDVAQHGRFTSLYEVETLNPGRARRSIIFPAPSKSICSAAARIPITGLERRISSRRSSSRRKPTRSIRSG